MTCPRPPYRGGFVGLCLLSSRLLQFLLTLYRAEGCTSARAHLQHYLDLWCWAPTVAVGAKAASNSNSSGDDDNGDADKWVLTKEETDSVVKDAMQIVRECAVGKEVRVAFEGESLDDSTLRGKVRSWDADSGSFR